MLVEVTAQAFLNKYADMFPDRKKYWDDISDSEQNGLKEQAKTALKEFLKAIQNGGVVIARHTEPSITKMCKLKPQFQRFLEGKE